MLHIIGDSCYGWYLHYLHSVGASMMLCVQYLHIGRSLYYGSYVYNVNVWLSGVYLMKMLMLNAFVGYVLIWGMMSYWGSTVISGLFIIVPCVCECICGGFYVCNPTLKRFFIVHMISGVLLWVCIIMHIYYLHVA